MRPRQASRGLVTGFLRARKSLFREVVRSFKEARNGFVEQKILFSRRRGHCRSVRDGEVVRRRAGSQHAIPAAEAENYGREVRQPHGLSRPYLHRSGLVRGWRDRKSVV